jgi:hypothetical protein
VTEERIREIVREELAAIAARNGAIGEAESIAYRAMAMHRFEEFMDEQHVPEDSREAIMKLMGALF